MDKPAAPAVSGDTFNRTELYDNISSVAKSSTPGADAQNPNVAGNPPNVQYLDFASAPDIYASATPSKKPAEWQANSSSPEYQSAYDTPSAQANAQSDSSSSNPVESTKVMIDPYKSVMNREQFYHMTADQLLTLPRQWVQHVQENNVGNLEKRAQALGDKLPNLVFRGVNRQETIAELEQFKDRDKSDSKVHFAIADKPASDKSVKIGDMATNFDKALNYAFGDQGKVYVFAYDGGAARNFLRKDHQQSAPEPFCASYAGEAVLPLDDKMHYVATLEQKDMTFNVPAPPYTLDQEMELRERSQFLQVDQIANALDQVLSTIEDKYKNQ
jgi:hypothetical protein